MKTNLPAIIPPKRKSKKKSPRVVKAAKTNLESIGIQFTADQLKTIINHI